MLQPVDRQSPVPLWAQLHEDLQRRLAAGEFAGAFPGEMALVDQYGISRNTVREAMRRLREDGVVVAGRGRKPRLAADTEIEQPLGALYSLFASVEASGLEQRSVVRALDLRSDPAAADQLERRPDEPLFHLERLRIAGDEPLALDRVWLPADLGAPLLDVDFRRTGFYHELLTRAGVALTGGREVIRAVFADEEDRALLALGPEAAVLSIDRISYTGEEPVEWRHTLVRGDRFSLVAEFSARDGYQLGVPEPESEPDAMSYDRDLANRIRELLATETGVTEKAMFGGLAFLIDGHMAVAASRLGGLLLRVEPSETASLLGRAHTEPFVMRDREMVGWLRVVPEGVRTKRQLEGWVAKGVAYARSLPPKLSIKPLGQLRQPF